MVVGAPIGALRRQPPGAFMISLYLVSGKLAAFISRILSPVDFVLEIFEITGSNKLILFEMLAINFRLSITEFLLGNMLFHH